MARSRDSRLNSFEKSLTSVAHRMGRCPVHGTLLWCAGHGYRWVGTDAEWEELMALLDRIELYHRQAPRSSQRCATCGDWLWCETCVVEAVGEPDIPDDLLTEQEEARYAELSQLMQPEAGPREPPRMLVEPPI